MLVLASTDATDPKVIASYLLDANSFTPSTEGNVKTYKMESPIETVVGNVNVYAFVNPKNGLTFTPGESINRVLTVADYTSLNSGMGNANATFFMANTKDVSTDLKAFNATDWNESSDRINKITVEVERFVSKVTFAKNTTVENETYTVKDGDVTVASAKVIGTNIINLNKKSNLLKQNMWYYDVDPHTYTNLFYVEDPNTTVMAYNTEEDKTAANSYITENFTYTSAVDDDFKAVDDPNGLFYCLENTMFTPAAQQNGQTTGAIYKVEFTPNATNGFTALAGGEGTTLGDNYKKYNATYPLGTDFWEQTAETKDFYVCNDLIFGNKEAAIFYKMLSDKTTVMTDEEITAFKTSYETEITKEDADLDYLTKYTDGICYYTAWIKHNAGETEFMAKGKYGVVRNHWYEMTVNSIKGLGTAKPTIPSTPEQPDDKVKSKLEVSVKIVPWRYISQSVDLE